MAPMQRFGRKITVSSSRMLAFAALCFLSPALFSEPGSEFSLTATHQDLIDYTDRLRFEAIPQEYRKRFSIDFKAFSDFEQLCEKSEYKVHYGISNEGEKFEVALRLLNRPFFFQSIGDEFVGQRKDLEDFLCTSLILSGGKLAQKQQILPVNFVINLASLPNVNFPVLGFVLNRIEARSEVDALQIMQNLVRHRNFNVIVAGEWLRALLFKSRFSFEFQSQLTREFFKSEIFKVHRNYFVRWIVEDFQFSLLSDVERNEFFKILLYELKSQGVWEVVLQSAKRALADSSFDLSDLYQAATTMNPEDTMKIFVNVLRQSEGNQFSAVDEALDQLFQEKKVTSTSAVEIMDILGSEKSLKQRISTKSAIQLIALAIADLNIGHEELKGTSEFLLDVELSLSVSERIEQILKVLTHPKAQADLAETLLDSLERLRRQNSSFEKELEPILNLTLQKFAMNEKLLQKFLRILVGLEDKKTVMVLVVSLLAKNELPDISLKTLASLVSNQNNDKNFLSALSLIAKQKVVSRDTIRLIIKSICNNPADLNEDTRKFIKRIVKDFNVELESNYSKMCVYGPKDSAFLPATQIRW